MNPIPQQAQKQKAPLTSMAGSVIGGVAGAAVAIVLDKLAEEQKKPLDGEVKEIERENPKAFDVNENNEVITKNFSLEQIERDAKAGYDELISAQEELTRELASGDPDKTRVTELQTRRDSLMNKIMGLQADARVDMSRVQTAEAAGPRREAVDETVYLDRPGNLERVTHAASFGLVGRDKPTAVREVDVVTAPAVDKGVVDAASTKAGEIARVDTSTTGPTVVHGSTAESVEKAIELVRQMRDANKTEDMSRHMIELNNFPREVRDAALRDIGVGDFIKGMAGQIMEGIEPERGMENASDDWITNAHASIRNDRMIAETKLRGGEHTEARAMLDEAKKEERELNRAKMEVDILKSIAAAYTLLGKTEEADAVLDQIQDKVAESGASPAEVAPVQEAHAPAAVEEAPGQEAVETSLTKGPVDEGLGIEESPMSVRAGVMAPAPAVETFTPDKVESVTLDRGPDLWAKILAGDPMFSTLPDIRALSNPMVDEVGNWVTQN